MSNQPSIAELRAEADALGLEGEEALNFVYKQQEFFRNERAAERAARAEEAERAAQAEERVARKRKAESVARAAEAEADRIARAEEREAEIEREVRAADALERERVREHELKVLKLTKKDNKCDQSLNDADMRPKLPQFKDGDDILLALLSGLSALLHSSNLTPIVML